MGYALQRRRLLAIASALGTTALTPVAEARRAAASVTPIPRGYAWVAKQHGIPAAVLFCVACQESVMRFGERSLPHPWTLCVRGEGVRLESYRQAVAALQGVLARGVTNVDCGAMQVNWHWHQARLITPQRALDPYPNLHIGAELLRQHHADTGDWFAAVGRYHNPSDKVRAQRYATGVFARIERMAAAATIGARPLPHTEAVHG